MQSLQSLHAQCVSGTLEIRWVHLPPASQPLWCDSITHVHRDDDAKTICSSTSAYTFFRVGGREWCSVGSRCSSPLLKNVSARPSGLPYNKHWETGAWRFFSSADVQTIKQTNLTTENKCWQISFLSCTEVLKSKPEFVSVSSCRRSSVWFSLRPKPATEPGWDRNTETWPVCLRHVHLQLPVFSVSRCSSCFSQMLSRSCRAEQETVTIRFMDNNHQVCYTNCEGNQSEPVVLFSPSVSLDSTEESWSNWTENTKHIRSNSCP